MTSERQCALRIKTHTDKALYISMAFAEELFSADLPAPAY